MSATKKFWAEISACTGLREGALVNLMHHLLRLIDRYQTRAETCACGDAALKSAAETARRFDAIADKLDGCLADWPKGEALGEHAALRELALHVRTEARLRAERKAAHRPRDDRRDRLMEEALALLEPHFARYAPGRRRGCRVFLHRAVAATLKAAGAAVPQDMERDAARFDRDMRRRQTDRAARRERLKDVRF